SESLEAPRVAVRERDAEGDSDLRRGAERLARVTVRLVEVPELEAPLLERVRGEHPVLALDRVPHLGGEPPERDRARVPVLLRLLRPLRPRLPVHVVPALRARVDRLLQRA